MPMVLRSRKTLHLGQAPEDDVWDRTPARTRRSTRLRERPTYEESDESEPEVMERQQGGPAELEEDAAEEPHTPDMKHCSVVLDRVKADDKAAKREIDERDDMNRKGGKPASRIPTFHKRPANASQSTEVSISKKDTPVHVLQPTEKSASGSVEASKPKLLDVREKSIHLPSVCTPNVGLEAPTLFTSTENAYGSPITALKGLSLSEFVQHPLLTVSPRPALRAEQGIQERVLEQDKSKITDAMLDDPIRNPQFDAPLSHKPQEDATLKYDTEVKHKCALGDGAMSVSADITHTPEVSQMKAIMDEEPPWEKEPTNPFELKDSRSSSEDDSEEDLAIGKPEGRYSGEVEAHHEPQLSQSEAEAHAEEQLGTDEATFPAAPEKPAKASPTKSTKRSGISSFGLFFLLPTTLLLLCGFGQHVWHYGLPMSVAQLTDQLELHWLEGLGLVPEPCSTDCRVHLVESIPVDLYPSTPSPYQSIADSWLHLLDKANSSVDIAAFYLTLRDKDLEFVDPTDSQGRKVFEQLKHLQSKGVKLQIAVNGPQTSTQDADELAAAGADVREVNLKAITGGIIHTKLWVVDQKHVYLGSANMDWRSLSQVKEVGLSLEDCSCLAQDAVRIFGVYWSIGAESSSPLPLYWPDRFSALSSSQHPLHLKLNGVPARVYLSSSPPQISARGRSDDLATILSVINDAQKFISISVMNYLPMSEYTEPIRFWPTIDSALRAAACTRGVKLRLLMSCWSHSPAAMFIFLQSLLVLSRPPLKCDIEVKVFTVPSTAEQMTIPFARVNHAKFMVTDRVLYIGTSNWSENYFSETAGVGLVVNQTDSVVGKGQQTLQSQAEELFLRDWSSAYARALHVDDAHVCPRGPH